MLNLIITLTEKIALREGVQIVYFCKGNSYTVAIETELNSCIKWFGLVLAWPSQNRLTWLLALFVCFCCAVKTKQIVAETFNHCRDS